MTGTILRSFFKSDSVLSSYFCCRFVTLFCSYQPLQFRVKSKHSIVGRYLLVCLEADRLH